MKQTFIYIHILIALAVLTQIAFGQNHGGRVHYGKKRQIDTVSYSNGDYIIIGYDDVGNRTTYQVLSHCDNLPIPVINGNQNICANGSTTLSTPTVANATYSWNTGATTQSITVNNAGTYKVWVKYADGCVKGSPNTTLVVNAALIPSLSITAPQSSICAGFTATFTASTANGGTSPTYQWLLNGQNIPTATGASLTLPDTFSTTWLKVAGGHEYSVGIKSDGTLWAWGYNYYGQLGDGTTINRLTPTKIGTDNNWTSIACGTNYTLAIKSDGTLWAWGDNNWGQLGDGTTISRLSPVKIGSSNNWQSISCSSYCSFAIKNNGTLWAWGYNGGRLGDGTAIDRHSPVQIGTSNNWASISSGNGRTSALKSDGTLWAWGMVFLGNGITTGSNSPIQIGTATNWTSVSCGESGQTLAIKSNGTLWAWGDNSFGTVGDGTTTHRKSPVQIGTSNNWVSILAAAGYSIAIDANNILWAWGINSHGGLGDGITTSSINPIQIGSAPNWTLLSAGLYHTLAIKNDGSLLAWGFNSYGQCGNGAVVDLSIPTITAPVTPLLLQLQAGDIITCQMTANNACQTISTVSSNGIIIQPTLIPDISINPSANPACIGTNVTFTTTTTNGGTIPNYIWVKNGIIVGNNSTSYTDNSLSNGDTIKCILISNAICANPTLDTSNIVIMSMPVLSANITSQTNVSCFSGNNGTATVSAIGGTAPYTYTWNTNPVQYSATATELGAGLHYVNIKDTNGCNASQGVTITQPNALGISLSTNPASNCNGCTSFTLIAQANGGVSPYSYVLDSGNIQLNDTFYNVSNGSHIISVTDNNACMHSQSISLGVSSRMSNNGAISEGNIISVYPNPSKGIYTISYHFKKADDKILSYELFDAQNRLISAKEQMLVKDISHYEYIDISHLADGIYWLHIKIDNELHIKKLIKE